MEGRTALPPPIGYARFAGFAYLLIIVLGVVSVGAIDSSLIVEGDKAATARNIVTHEEVFRLGIAGTIILYASVLALSWSLYVVLKPINARLCLLALLFRSAEGVLGAATAILSLAVLAVLAQEGSDVPHLVGTLVEARTAALDIVLVFVGVGGTAFCYLFFASKFIPRFLSVWGIVTYGSMLGLGMLSILWPGHPRVIELVLYGSGTLFEVSIGLWLLVKAINIQKWSLSVGGSK